MRRTYKWRDYKEVSDPYVPDETAVFRLIITDKEEFASIVTNYRGGIRVPKNWCVVQ